MRTKKSYLTLKVYTALKKLGYKPSYLNHKIAYKFNGSKSENLVIIDHYMDSIYVEISLIKTYMTSGKHYEFEFHFPENMPSKLLRKMKVHGLLPELEKKMKEGKKLDKEISVLDKKIDQIQQSLEKKEKIFRTSQQLINFAARHRIRSIRRANN